MVNELLRSLTTRAFGVPKGSNEGTDRLVRVEEKLDQLLALNKSIVA